MRTGVSRILCIIIILSCGMPSVFAGRADNMEFQDGVLKTDAGTQAVLNFPNISTAYVYADRFHSLLQAEVFRRQAIHGDVGIGEQFVGVSLGYTMLAAGNLSVLAGYGYDLDQSSAHWFAGVSHRSTLFSLGSLKSFVGYDFLLSRVRGGVAYNLYSYRNWYLDAVGTTRLLGQRNFLGLSLGRDILDGKGGGSKHKLEADVGVFAGYDFSEPTKNGIGAGLAANIRF